MAKKLGKFLLGMAAIGGVAAATYYYLQKKDAVIVTPENNDEDYDDFSDELNETAARNYVQLNTETTEEPACEEDVIEETPSEEANTEAAATEVVEEFFNEEDSIAE